MPCNEVQGGLLGERECKKGDGRRNQLLGTGTKEEKKEEGGGGRWEVTRAF